MIECPPNDACDAGINRNANPNAAICRRIVRNIRPTLQQESQFWARFIGPIGGRRDNLKII